jgi:hypothetical protein
LQVLRGIKLMRKLIKEDVLTMELSVTEQVGNLERKAERFDDAVDRIMDLKLWVENFESGDVSHHGVINKVKSLISFYESSSRAWIAKIEEQGYQQGELEKYFDSKFNGEKIITVKATRDGEVFANTESGQHLIGRMEDDHDYKQGLDYILCGLQFTEGLELIK